MGPINLHSHKNRGLSQKLLAVNWSYLLVVTIIASIGFLELYSAARGNLSPWADRQMMRFIVGTGILITAAVIDLKHWLRWSYLFFFLSFIGLVVVELFGFIGMGAQRWINIGFFQLQPSELVKVAIILALARYFHFSTPTEVRQLRHLIIPTLMILVPAFLVILQPDLGTALMLIMIGGIIMFAAGIPMWIFTTAIVGACAAIPVLWQFLHDYQKQRVYTFLNPESDPLGSGYHIIQSKIALGSGGFWGKGFLNGSQGYLNYVPEKQTDFIFSLFSEELGMFGGIILLSLYLLLVGMGYKIAFNAKSQFAKLVAIGVSSSIFLYVFINMSMVMGLLPVVGVPLPLLSYGGTSLLTLLMAMGFMMSIEVHPNSNLHRPSQYEG